jgi:large subunit ribosomal protein L29
MDANEMRGMLQEDLNKELLSLRREQFNLRMQRATGQLARPHEYGRVNKDIARVKTILGQLKLTSKSE